MSYYRYKFWGAADFYANSIESILGTVNHFAQSGHVKQLGISVPDKKSIQEVDEINLTWVWPASCEYHYVDVNIADDIKFRINANAYDMLLIQLNHLDGAVEGFTPYETMLESEVEKLYRFCNSHRSLVWFPESIVDKLKNHDWDQYKPLIEQCKREFDQKMEEINALSLGVNINELGVDKKDIN